MKNLYIDLDISSILNPNLIKFINTLDTDNKDINDFLNIILELGFSTYNHINKNSIIYNKDSGRLNNIILNQIDDSLTNNTDKLLGIITEIKDNTNHISHLFNKSSIKGIYGENLINETFSNYFPNYSLKDVANLPHSGDFHLFMDDINEMVIIESKFYNHTIDQKEINKLYYDMNNTGIKYSLFISLSSNIANKKNDIEWEINNDNIVIFISNVMNNNNYIIIGLMMLKTLISLSKENTGTNIQNFSLNSYKKISEHINTITSLKTQINKIKNSISNIHSNVSSQILELYNSITILDNEFSQKLNLLQNSITNEFQSINNVIESNDLEHIYNNINNITNANNKKMLNTIISDLYSNNFYVDDKWHIYQKNIKKGEIIILKTMININLSNNLQLKNIKLENWNSILTLFNVH